ncbi:MAG TPA: hypothetical protein ENG01_01140 [Candidatus Aenigmarchaeota archaeon]|nr:hypothetical protein [Candidatus Aenigmarchaeota archaeon]HEX33001.1 hypothetical protein [Candidatus Aenigmarchaeota archaeon]
MYLLESKLSLYGIDLSVVQNEASKYIRINSIQYGLGRLILNREFAVPQDINTEDELRSYVIKIVDSFSEVAEFLNMYNVNLVLKKGCYMVGNTVLGIRNHFKTEEAVLFYGRT